MSRSPDLAILQPLQSRGIVVRNPLSPKKLLLSKWTAVCPADKEKHFVVTRVVEPDPPAVRVDWVEIEAVHSGRPSMLRWRDLIDGNRWRQGWV